MDARGDALGIDVGGVIIEPADHDEDTSFFGDNYLRTPVVADAFEAIAELVDGRFGERTYLVSKCGAQTERRTRHWLEHHGFHARTGVPPERLRFCRARPDKAPIAAGLGLTHFVDDRLEVLGYLSTVEHRFLFRPSPDEIAAYAEHLPRVRRVESWPELVPLLLADDAPDGGRR